MKVPPLPGPIVEWNCSGCCPLTPPQSLHTPPSMGAARTPFSSYRGVTAANLFLPTCKSLWASGIWPICPLVSSTPFPFLVAARLILRAAQPFLNVLLLRTLPASPKTATGAQQLVLFKDGLVWRQKAADRLSSLCRYTVQGKETVSSRGNRGHYNPVTAPSCIVICDDGDAAGGWLTPPVPSQPSPAPPPLPAHRLPLRRRSVNMDGSSA